MLTCPIARRTPGNPEDGQIAPQWLAARFCPLFTRRAIHHIYTLANGREGEWATPDHSACEVPQSVECQSPVVDCFLTAESTASAAGVLCEFRRVAPEFQQPLADRLSSPSKSDFGLPRTFLTKRAADLPQKHSPPVTLQLASSRQK